MSRSAAWLFLILALASCGAGDATPEVVAASTACPEVGCSLPDDDGLPQRLAEIAGQDEQDTAAERWGYDPIKLPRVTDDQYLVFVAAEVATECQIVLRALNHEQTEVVLSFEQTQDSGVCLDVAMPSSTVVMLSGQRPDRIRSSEETEFQFIP